jgi:hypothetical protein
MKSWPARISHVGNERPPNLPRDGPIAEVSQAPHGVGKVGLDSGTDVDEVLAAISAHTGRFG